MTAKRREAVRGSTVGGGAALRLLSLTLRLLLGRPLYEPFEDIISREDLRTMLRGSVLTAALLIFVDGVKELPATLILRPFNFETLATTVYNAASLEQLDEAGPAALAIVVVGLLPVVILARTMARARPGDDVDIT